MNIRCPNCRTLYRVEPSRIPANGGQARCGRCAEVFPVAAPSSGAMPAAAMTPAAAPAVAPAPVPAATPAATHVPAPATAPAAATSAAGVHFFGPQDPHQRARNLARALVSDIVAYYPDRLERSRTAGTLREEFREEILKSWEEFSLQVGTDFARETDHFQTALNEILARGAEVF